MIYNNNYPKYLEKQMPVRFEELAVGEKFSGYKTWYEKVGERTCTNDNGIELTVGASMLVEPEFSHTKTLFSDRKEGQSFKVAACFKETYRKTGGHKCRETHRTDNTDIQPLAGVFAGPLPATEKASLRMPSTGRPVSFDTLAIGTWFNFRTGRYSWRKVSGSEAIAQEGASSAYVRLGTTVTPTDIQDSSRYSFPFGRYSLPNARCTVVPLTLVRISDMPIGTEYKYKPEGRTFSVEDRGWETGTRCRAPDGGHMEVPGHWKGIVQARKTQVGDVVRLIDGGRALVINTPRASGCGLYNISRSQVTYESLEGSTFLFSIASRT